MLNYDYHGGNHQITIVFGIVTREIQTFCPMMRLDWIHLKGAVITSDIWCLFSVVGCSMFWEGSQNTTRQLWNNEDSWVTIRQL